MICFLILAVCIHMIRCSASSTSISLCIPSNGQTLLFVGQDTDSIEQYSSYFGVPAGTMVYSSLENITWGLKNANNYGSGEEYGTGLLKSFPNTALNLGLYLVGH